MSTTPTLHDDRVERMRRSVMHHVDQDVSRRGRRARTAIGLAAASVVVVGLGGYALGTTGGATSSRIGASDSGASSDSAAGGTLDGLSSDEAAAPDTANLSPSTETAKRQVVTIGSIAVTVKDPRSAAQRLSTYVESIGGRVDDRSENAAGDDTGDGAAASVTVRVPSDRVTTTVDRLATYGTVDDVSLQNSDVTAQTTDLDARIDALRISIDRLSAILSGASSSKDVIAAEDALTQRQEELESLQAQRAGLADQVKLSTLTVGFSQSERTDAVEPGGFGGGLRDGWNGLVATLNAVVEVAGVLLPWAVLGGSVLLVGRLVANRRRTWN